MRLTLFFFTFFAFSCSSGSQSTEPTLDSVAEEYVKLVLVIGDYDKDFVDAYYGPEEWKPTEYKDQLPFEELKWQTISLLDKLETLGNQNIDSLQLLRLKFMHKQLVAVKTRLDVLGGFTMPFDVESMVLYDAVSPSYDTAHYNSFLENLEMELPGEASLATKYLEYSNIFVIDSALVDSVFQTAIAEARRRTMLHMELPEGESFRIEYVTEKPWSAYNWYKGEFNSLIQVNIDLPITIDRVIDLACHEGYPGHHVFNAMLEKNLVNDQGMVEFSVYPLFSPQSLIAEGTANYGIEMAFPGAERLKYEKEVLFPLVGINPDLADKYYRIQNLRAKLNYAGNEAARAYLNGQTSREQAAAWIEKYNLYSPERALQRTEFMDRYRSYVINYNLGKDLVEAYVSENSDSVARWDSFKTLLTSPRIASTLN